MPAPCRRPTLATDPAHYSPPQPAVAEIASIAGSFTKSLTPAAEYFNTLGLPAPLIKLGHPGNMCAARRGERGRMQYE